VACHLLWPAPEREDQRSGVHQIDRSPEEVFGFISVRANDPVWMASVTVSEWLDPDAPMAVGRRGRMVMQATGGASFWTR
jgi:hypothetical protein